MWIEEIIMEGFKSYHSRTVVGPFDRQFNAITGLNGSGKSNILDAICFVLGITNLSQIRVSTLQELVFSNGNADVTKATVTIVFNNTDKADSPIGYEQYEKITVARQVAIGGRSKYLVNGVSKPNSVVQTLFHSVQLNINNPHFLIMQGRVTKVLNMKPPEILAMIEEAAGTRMYEAKKQQTMKTLEKKKPKITEIDRILEQDIRPRLERLRGERQQYVQFSAGKTEIERLARVVVAYDFYRADCTVHHAESEQATLAETLRHLAESQLQLQQDFDKMNAKIAQQTEEREKALQGTKDKYEDAVTKASEMVVRCKAAATHAKESVTQEKEKLAALQSTAKESAAAIEEKRKAIEQQRKRRETIEAAHSKSANNLKELQRQFETLSLGVSVEEGKEEAASAADTLLRVRKEASEAEAEAKNIRMEASHAESALKAKRAAVKDAERNEKKLQGDLEAAIAEEAAIVSQLQAQGCDPTQLPKLQADRRETQDTISQLQRRADELSSRLTRFDYCNGGVAALARCGVDVKKVHGVVAELVNISDPSNYLALEVCAGGKLYNIVVDDEDTGSRILNSKQLRRSVTIIPLSVIRSKPITAQQMRTIKGVCGGDDSAACTALSLVGFPEDIRAAMEFVFGSTLICKDKDVAKLVAFHPNIRTRCVTLAGDVYDPSGTMSGGSAPSSKPVLGDLHELNETRTKLTAAKAHLEEISKQYDSLRRAVSACQELTRKHDLAAHRVEILKERAQTSEHAKLQKEIADTEAQLAACKERIAQAEAKHAEANKRAEELEAKAKALSSTGGRENELKRLETEIAKSKKKEAVDAKSLAEITQVFDKLAMELEALEHEQTAQSEQIEKAQESVKQAVEEQKAAERELALKRGEHDAACAELEARKSETRAQLEAIHALEKQRDAMETQMNKNEATRKNTEARSQRLVKDRADAEKLLTSMLVKHPWISAERAQFGQKGGDYDWSDGDAAVERARARLTALQAEHEKLSKVINRKAVAMYDTADRDCTELVHKKAIVEQDREKITAAIAELDTKKAEALRATWKCVNTDLASIFSSLYPGATARLEPPAGGTGDAIIDGLELRVALNGAWKDGLTELSGGQRSLLALSLILALLRFKPAPVYILDEVDAALDPSHTQNIGKMLAAHFRASQFIVVSLKKGMWANANVLFKVRCVDGMSTVTRFTGSAVPDREADFVLNKQSGETATAESSGVSTVSSKGKRRAHKDEEEEDEEEEEEDDEKGKKHVSKKPRK